MIVQRRSHIANVLVWLAVGAAVGCGANEDRVATGLHHRKLDTRIVGGTPSQAEDDTVVMLVERGQLACSGTLVAPNLILTARHCVTDMSETGPCGTFTTNHAPSGIGVALGADANPRQVVARGKQLFHEAGLSGCSNDIALILLDRDVQNPIAPVRLSVATPGEDAYTVGFGDDGSGELTDGRHRKDGISIDAVGASSYMFQPSTGRPIMVQVPAGELLTGESTCYGDSGGPLFDAQDEVIGVTSRGIDDSCIDRPSIFSGLATHADLIRGAFAAAGHPLPPPKPTTPEVPSENSSSGGVPSGSSSGGKPPSGPGASVEASPTPPAASVGCQAAPGAATLTPALLALALVACRRRAVREHVARPSRRLA
jgi:hypothetical protein